MQFSSDKPAAGAWMKGGKEAPYLSGTVRFYPCTDGVLVVARICGLPLDNPGGFFGFHIHQGDTCRGQKFSGTGSHYDPKNVPHPNHAGDLPPLLGCKGRACMSVLTDRFRVSEIIGRTVVIHSGSDDFRSQPAGDAGEKIACGVIRAVENRR